MALVLGLSCKAYRNEGTWAAPDWTLVANMTGAKLNLETGEADVTTRGGNGWRQTAATLKNGSVEFQMIWDTESEDFTAVQEAWEDGENIEMLFLDGDVTTVGSQGLRAEFAVTNFSRDESLEEAVKVDVTLKPGYSTVNAPYWFTSAGS